MATIRTGASAYLKYEYETSYATGGTPNKKFGLQDRLTNWSLTHNRIDMPQLNQTTIQKYAYGQQSGTLSVGFVLSNPWIFESIYGAPSTGSASSGVYPHTFGATAADNKSVNTLVCEVGYDGDSADIVRTLKGCIVNSLGISTSIGETVNCSVDMTYGKETAPSTTLGTAPSEPTEEFAYTFAHGVIKVGGNTLAQVQDVDITFGQNPSLLYGIGSNHAVNSYRQVFDITGRFRASLLNKNLLEGVLAQIAKNTSGTYEETIGGSPEFELTFQSTASSTQNEIKITGTGLAPTDLNISGIEPVEPIFEEINWRVKSATVVASNTQSGPE
tara:strand:+ start:1173 stop:2162 length:990 start_codon:yes stop_codon:yes gene_type:complete